jgi:hypothetical protein
MTYAILWISYVGFGLLLVAAVTAIASRCKRILYRRFWPILATILAVIPIAVAVFFGYFILANNFQPKWLFWYCFSGLIAYLIGALIIIIHGLKRSSGEEQKAKSWPRAWPAALAGAALFVFATTLNIADMRVMDHLADIKHIATAKIQDMLPAKLPKSLNAHFVYEDAVQAFMPDKDLPEWFKKSGDPDFDPSSPEIQGFITEHNDVLEIMRKAKSIPGYSIPVDTSFYVASPIPNYRPYWHIAEFISLYTRSLAKKGEVLRALKELPMIERMADHFRSFPLFISVIVAHKLESIRCSALECLLAQGFHPPGELMPLPINEHRSILEDFAASLSIEALCMIQAAAVNFSLANYSGMFSMSENFKHPFISPTFTAKFFRVFCGHIEIKGMRNRVVYSMNKEADSYEVLKTNLKSISDAEKAGEMGFMTVLISPSYYGYISRAMKCDVHRGLCDLAMAVTAYRAKNNSYPADLKELVPEYIDRIPLDPFDGKPLKMKSVDGGLDLYSVGSEKEDEYNDKIEPIHFYMGKEAYEKFRVKPALEEKRKQAQKKNE